MAEMTLKDVIERLKSEGQLIRNTGTNSLKSMKETLVVISENIIEQTSILREMLELNQEIYNDQKSKEQLQSVGKSIIDNRRTSTPETPAIEESINETVNIFSGLLKKLGALGVLAGAAAIAVGGAIGVVRGQIQAIAIFFPTVVQSISKSFNDFIKSITSTFTNAVNFLRTSMRLVFANIIVVFDDLLAFLRGNFLPDSQSMMARALTAVGNLITRLVEPFLDLGRMISDLISGPVSNIRSSFTGIMNGLRTFGSVLAGIARVVSRVFLPLTIIMTAFDTINEAIQGFAESGILGGLEGAINGFVTSLITMPLDFVTNMAAWVIDKLGFDETADAFREFSFSDLFRSLTRTIFGTIESFIGWVGTIFTDPRAAFDQSLASLLGVGRSIVDLFYAPVDSFVTWIQEKLGWSDENAPSFSMIALIDDWVESFTNWVSEIFSFLPSVDEVKRMMFNALPNWMQRLIGGEDLEVDTGSPNNMRNQITALQAQREQMIMTAQEAAGTSGIPYIDPDTSRIDSQIAELAARMAENSNRDGTRGFLDFGAMSPALLHGIEAVVPRNTEAGEFLDRFFNENWERITPAQQILSRSLSEVDTYAASSMQPIIINNTPVTNMPVNNITGGTNVTTQSNTTVIGNGGSGLGRFAN
jgi:hypothetical protein